MCHGRERRGNIPNLVLRGVMGCFLEKVILKYKLEG